MTGTIASLRNSQGLTLHCMVDDPPGPARSDCAAVLLCPGVKTRVGPHRLYRKLAQAFLRRGIAVMRVDFAGLGDSEGEQPEESLELIYRAMELGGGVADARSALDWLEAARGVRRFIVGGLCGGAVTGLQLAAEDPRVEGIYAIGLPVTVHGAARSELDHMPQGALRDKRAHYLKKALNPASWLRLLSMKSDYRLMWRMLAASMASKQKAAHEAARPAAAPDLNPRLAESFLKVVGRDCRVLLMFGERDRLRWDFEEKLQQPWQADLAPYRTLIETRIIPRASHILADPEAVAQASQITVAWLDAWFPDARHAEAQAEEAAA